MTAVNDSNSVLNLTECEIATPTYNSRFHSKDGTPHTCPTCHSKNIDKKIEAHMEHFGFVIDTEIAYYCEDCNTCVAYWAYGYFDHWFTDNTLKIWWINRGAELYQLKVG